MTLLHVNPETKRQLKRTSNHLPQALLLDGPAGVGLHTIAREMAGRELADEIMPLDSHGDRSTAGSIKVETIRELQVRARSKLTTRRIMIIDDADTMTHAAQNAFLKLLEEPVPQLHFILTSHAPQALLATVLSRVQRIHVRPISRTTSELMLSQAGTTEPRKVQQLLFLADGLPAELSRLMQDEARFSELATSIADARQFLEGTPYARAMVALRYQKDRAAALKLLELATLILTRNIQAKPTRHLILRASEITDAHEAISQNSHTGLQLIRLVV